MVNYQPRTTRPVPPSADLDGVFAALADPTRRAIVERLSGHPAPVGALAQGAPMSLPGFMKHLAILERAGLLVRRKEGRVVQCALAPRALGDAADWLERYRRFWEERLDSLERFLDRQEDSPWPKAPSKRSPRSPSNARSAPRRSTSGRRGPRPKR